MTFSEFCQAFYHGRSKSSLQHYASKNAISGFLMRIAVGRESWDRFEATDQDNRKRISWFDGTSKPDKELWRDARDGFNLLDYARELEAALPSVDSDLLKKTAKKFELDEPIKNKSLFAEALAEQFRALADGDGISRNLVPETYKELLFRQSAQSMASDVSVEKEPTLQQNELLRTSDDRNDQQNEITADSDVQEPVIVLSKRSFYRIIFLALFLFIVIPVATLSILERIPIDTSKALKPFWDEHANSILTSFYTNDQKLEAADKLYSWSKNIEDADSRNRYYIYSAILKEEVLNRRFTSEQDIRIATQGINICQSVLESAPEESCYNYMAHILRCLFYEVLGDTADETIWSQDVKLIEEYFDSCSLDIRNNEDALISNYGYRALMDYYDRILQEDYHLGTEEIYKKYIDYYNTRCNNQFLAALSSGSATPSFDLNGFAAYSEKVFRLIKLNPSYDYVTYLSDIVDQCEDNQGSLIYMDKSTYENMKLTSIMADAYYHWSLIAENEVNEYDLDQVRNLRWKADSLFEGLLEITKVDQWEKLDIIIKAILKSSSYGFSPSKVEEIKHFGDIVLDLPEWGFAPSQDAISELKTAVCVSCYNIRKNNYISDTLIDLGKRAAEFMVPIDTYDLVVTAEDIPVIREYLETCETEAQLMGRATEDPSADE